MHTQRSGDESNSRAAIMLFEAYLTDHLKFLSVANTGAILDVLLQ